MTHNPLLLSYRARSGFLAPWQAEILARWRYRWSKWTPAGVAYLAKCGKTPFDFDDAEDHLQLQ